MKKTLLKTITLLLLLFVISTSLYFVIYPNYSKAKIAMKQFDITQISNNTFLNILSTISYPTIQDTAHEQGEVGTLEYISQEKLEEHKEKYGVVKMEEVGTKLKIEKLDISGDVVDGDDANSMDRGFWYYPLSAPPGKQGNTVLIGHRFLHLPPRQDTFFNLDKLKTGDKVEIEQGGNQYKYTVINVRVVDKNDSTILKNTNDYRITLVTCTPLWTSEKRLVVTGKLDKVYGII